MPRENVESGTEATAQNKLPAQDWNRVVYEVNNTIKDAGITPQVFEDNEDLSVQQSQAIMHNALCADFFSDYTTDPNNLILDNNGTFQRPTKYINGMKISFVANYSNTYEACSVNVCGLGTKAIYSDKERTGLPYNSIKKNQINNIIYLEELDAFLLLRSGNNFMQKIGELIISTIPFDDDKLHLANGDFLPADSQYLDFYKFMKDKHDSGKYNNIFCSEAEYNASISSKGRCAKYVFSEGFGIRLPTINGIIEGTTNVNELGQLTEESLPQHKHYINNNSRGGTYSAPQDGTLINSSNHMSNNDYFLCGSTTVEPNLYLSSKANNTVYKDNAKVHPETVKQFFYIVVGTYIDDNVPIDKLNLKANRNLDNLQTILIETATDVDTIKTSGNYQFLLGTHTNTPFSTENSAFGMLVLVNNEYVYQYVWGYDNSSYHRFYNPIEATWGGWKNIDIGSSEGGTQVIGQVIQVLCSPNYVPSGCLPCNGAEYTKEQFPDLWNNYLTTNPSLLGTCSYDIYNNTINVFGQCPLFAVDTENYKFKTPTIKDGSYITQAKSDSELGRAIAESLPNITGGPLHVSAWEQSTTTRGALTATATGSSHNDTGGTGWNLTFNASNSSSVYQDNAKVQGDNVRARFFVVVANGEINQSQMDWSAWASSLQGKTNINLDNIDTTAKETITSLSAPSSRYIEISLPANTDTQYTAPANGYVSVNGSTNSNGGAVQVYNSTKKIGNSGSRTGTAWIGCSIPVEKGDVCTLYEYNCSNYEAKFIYSNGN
ncbi:hypothetical protein [uncultured Clostridium sp.]|uniref:hypothetical protein n=1 Tax=uncultured Clostridium sp. TaxID=59620 RepID=UPI0025CED411|nr:hypothetical protein [uncultured Clostridium sp.]